MSARALPRCTDVTCAGAEGAELGSGVVAADEPGCKQLACCKAPGPGPRQRKSSTSSRRLEARLSSSHWRLTTGTPQCMATAAWNKGMLPTLMIIARLCWQPSSPSSKHVSGVYGRLNPVCYNSLQQCAMLNALRAINVSIQGRLPSHCQHIHLDAGVKAACLIVKHVCGSFIQFALPHSSRSFGKITNPLPVRAGKSYSQSTPSLVDTI